MLSLAAIVLFVREPAALKTRRRQRRRDQEAGGGRKAGRPPYRAIFTPPIIAFVVVAFTSHYAMGAWDVVWSLYLSHLGASKTFISFTWVAFSVPMLLSVFGGMVADRYSRFWLFIDRLRALELRVDVLRHLDQLLGPPRRQRRWRASPSPSRIRPSRRS